MSDTINDWVILELLGHRVLGGHLTEQQIAGMAFLRLEVPAAGDAPPVTQFYAPSSVYAITPTDEETARAVARRRRPAPVNRWELEPLPSDDSEPF
ncbi:hypothetical protein SAMN05421505_1499 [Sinosporangium album]|uniref:Uncharacterized protein n=1 Tax=Sinosporangium album TaxID=504805 RepID=A0A1G8KAQ7_9ACTN|nr:hypothetical protein [Sinosporangium album]SDI40504.1 hypothetical protein SAMN05421505_1499 [Sinosporangium album]